jgi:hypothetical protein
MVEPDFTPMAEWLQQIRGLLYDFKRRRSSLRALRVERSIGIVAPRSCTVSET